MRRSTGYGGTNVRAPTEGSNMAAAEEASETGVRAEAGGLRLRRSTAYGSMVVRGPTSGTSTATSGGESVQMRKSTGYGGTSVR